VVSLLHILAWDVLVTTNAILWQIGKNKIPYLLHPHSKLGNNSISAMRSKKCMVFGMLIIFGIIPLPLLHINSNIILNFLPTCMLTKGIPFSNKDFILPFHLTIDLTLDSVTYHLTLNKILPMVVL
jgi:hypothetical protein